MKFLKNMNDEFNLVNNAIKEYFGNNLASLVIFGSSCRKKRFNIISDLDYIIVLNKKVTNQDVLSRKLKAYLKNYFALLSFNIYDKKTFINIIQNQDWLVLSVKLGYYIIFDNNNFFRNIVEKRYAKIKSKRIAPLGWYVKNGNFEANFTNHLISLSKGYLKSSRVVFQKKIFTVANLLLLNSVHCYLSVLLLKRNIFITKGEISQCFIKNYNIGFNNKLSKNLLELEQICGQIEKMSFNFALDGYMKYIDNDKYFSKFYKEKLKMFINLMKDYSFYE